MAGFAERFPELARDLGPENLELLLRHTTPLDVPAGRAFIRDRMTVDTLYFILEGTVSVSVEEAGRAISLGKLGPGQWLGEVSVLSGELLAASTVVAETPVRLLRLKHQAFEELINSNRQIGEVLLKYLVEMLAERLRTSEGVAGGPLQIEEVTAPSAAPAPSKGRNWLRAFFGQS